MRRARRHVFVHRRLLLVPRETQPGALGELQRVRHAQDAGGARGRGGQRGTAGRRRRRHPFVFDDELDGQRVRDGEAGGGGGHVAEGVQGGVDVGGEVDLDGAEEEGVAAVVVGVVGRLDGVVEFPAVLDLVPADDARVLVGLGFGLALELVGVLGAGGRDVRLVLLDAPDDAPEPVAVDGVVSVDGDETPEAEEDVEVADRVHGGLERGFGDELGGRKDALEYSGVAAWGEGALYVELVRVRQDLASRQGGFGDKVVGERGE